MAPGIFGSGDHNRFLLHMLRSVRMSPNIHGIEVRELKLENICKMLWQCMGKEATIHMLVLKFKHC